MKLNFSLVSSIDSKKTFSFRIKYEVVKEAYGQQIVIQKEINKYFTFRTTLPFQYFLNWKTNLKEINHTRDAKMFSSKHPLPLNNTSCLNITLSPIQNDVIILDAAFRINKTSNYQILKEPEIQKGQILSKNQLYTTHFVIRPVSPVEDLQLGELKLTVMRLNEKDRTDKHPVPISISLENIIINPKLFTINVESSTQCCLGDSVPYKVRIQNSSGQLHKLEVAVSENDSFFLTGPTRLTVEILPKSVKVLEYLLVPVAVGKQKVPSCSIKCLTLEGEVLLDTDEAVITYVFPAPNN